MHARHLLAVLVAFGATAAACIYQPVLTDSDTKSTETDSSGDRVMRAGRWKWVVTYRSKGTRSEGQQGDLYFHGLAITDGTIGEERDTPFGTLKYYGPVTEGKPWAVSGWHYADESKILASWQEDSATEADR